MTRILYVLSAYCLVGEPYPHVGDFNVSATGAMTRILYVLSDFCLVGEAMPNAMYMCL